MALVETGGEGPGRVVLLSSAHCLDQYPQPLADESSSASREQQRAGRAQVSPGSRTCRGLPRDQGADGLDLLGVRLLSWPDHRSVQSSRGHRCFFLFREEGKRTQSLTGLVQTNQKPQRALFLVFQRPTIFKLRLQITPM